MTSLHSHSREAVRADRAAGQVTPLPSLGGAQPVPVLKVNGAVVCALRSVPIQMRAPRLARCPKCADPAGDVSARSCQEQSCPIRHDAQSVHEDASA